MTSLRRPAMAAILVLTLAGCGAEQPGTAPDGQTPTDGGSTAQQAPQDACLPVPPDMLTTIAGGADSPPITPVTGAAVKSTDYAQVYMIAMKFSAPGGADETGVWASDSLEPGGGLILAMDGFAQQFTHWPKGDQTKFAITQAAHGVAESEACVK